MNINISYTYTPEQITRAIRFNYFPTKGSKWFCATVTAVCILFSCLLWRYPVSNRPETFLVTLKYVMLMTSILWCILLFVLLYAYFVIAPKVYWKQTLLRADFEVQFTEQALITTQKSNELLEIKEDTITIPWSKIVRKAENLEFIFLYESKKKVYCIPKIAFTNTEDFKALHLFLGKKSNIKIKTFNTKKLWKK